MKKRLTPKERQIVSLRADGVSTEAIATRMNLTYKTVQNYLYKAARKKQCDTTADLMIYVWRKRMARDVENPQPPPVSS